MRRLILISSLVLASSVPALAEGTVGLGLGVGIATGPNLQVMTTPSTHVDIGVGYELQDRLRLQADHAWRLADLSGAATVRLPLYLGVGGFWSDRYRGVARGGLRMPLGLQADFARAPIQLFGEVSPELVVLEVVDAGMTPPPDTLAITGLAGVRAAF